ncbi:MAG TPA: zf-TFIIB domain-containing protein [Fimbriimonas sp.]
MNCPIDGTQLVIAERQGVEIDYCPQCRGVWLDRGELDKLIDRSASVAASPTYRRDDEDDRRRGFDPHSKHRKKKGWLDDIFDF